jgi:pimeloyl-ACP methyl ester carboxylesterase
MSTVSTPTPMITPPWLQPGLASCRWWGLASPPMDLILVPGMWLDASTWDPVVPALEAAGHSTHALTLPGMASKDADRSGITLQDHVDAVTAAIDAVPDGQVVLIGHSIGAAIAHAAADARIDRVARVCFVAGEPLADGVSNDPGFPSENGEIPLPEWSFFDEEMYADLDEEAQAAFRARAIPFPERVVTDPHRLGDDRRHDVPATLIACEYPTAMLKDWVAQGHPGAQEVGLMRNIDFVDLPGGHWPQLTQPEPLTKVLLARIGPSPR